MPSLATFNANNFFLRYRFDDVYPGDESEKSKVEAAQVGLQGYLPSSAIEYLKSNYIIWDSTRRKLATQALSEPDGQLPDILCLQEVENMSAIRRLNEEYLDKYYHHALLIDGYDPRNIDVALLSRFPIIAITTHVDDLNADGLRVFSRDNLEVTLLLPDGKELTLYINHFKSKFIRRKPDESDDAFVERRIWEHQRRLAQTQAVLHRIVQRFSGHHDTSLYAVVGDFNDTPESPWIEPIMHTPLLTDVVRRHSPANDCWTYFWRSKNRVSQIDYVLASTALRDRVDAVVAAAPEKRPHIERKGVGYRELNAQNLILPKETNLVYFEPDEVTPPPPVFTPSEKIAFRFDRYPEVLSNWKENISDHCPVKVWF